MPKLANKIALITGAAGGQGTEEAELFVREGAAVMLTDIDAAKGEALAARLSEAGGRALFRGQDAASGAPWRGDRAAAPAPVRGPPAPCYTTRTTPPHARGTTRA